MKYCNKHTSQLQIKLIFREKFLNFSKYFSLYIKCLQYMIT